MFDAIAEGLYMLVSRSFDSNIGLIVSGDSRALVDAGTGVYHETLEKGLSRLGITSDMITDILLTHSHVDHIGGVTNFLRQGSPKIHLHKEEADLINSGDMKLTLASTFGAEIPRMDIKGILNEGDTIMIGDIEVKVLHTPGHSSGSVCYHIEEQGVIYTGDTMFSGGSFGRVDFPTGNPIKIVASLKRLSEIEKFQTALPGHMSPVRNNATKSALASYQQAKLWFNVG